MNEARKNEVLFDSLLKISLADALEEEISELPSISELNQEYEPSPELNNRINALISKSIIKSKFQRISKKLGKIAAFIGIVLIISSIVLFSVSATRNAILNAIIQWKEEYSEVKFVDSEANGTIYRPTYLPSGFRENVNEKYGNTVMMTYTNGEGDQIIFNQWPYDAGTSLVDSENTNYIETQVSGEKAYIFEALTNKDSTTLIWQSNGIVFELTAKEDISELKLIGESLKKG